MECWFFRISKCRNCKFVEASTQIPKENEVRQCIIKSDSLQEIPEKAMHEAVRIRVKI
jgi:hypothetical protein